MTELKVCPMSAPALLALFLAGPAMALVPAPAPPVRLLSRMSLEQLASVEVTSVSKSAQALGVAPASVYVITNEEILRSGVTAIPEALRLAPNLQVTQLTSGDYNISARGFGGNQEAQNFPNKILILIDGRSVYTPLFSGVSYDAQDVLLEDVDRIEVISGPGATLWGANAMNGVINIITRTAAETPGGLLTGGGGNQESGAGARYGGTIGEVGAFRVYAKAFDREELENADGTGAADDWQRGQAGFRMDLGRGRDSFTFQGDVYSGDRGQAGAPDASFSGVNALSRWTHTTGHTATRLQAYFDRTERDRPLNGAGFTLDTWDIELQQTIDTGSRHSLVWGGGIRNHNYTFDLGEALLFEPEHRVLRLADVFIQDTLALRPSLHLTAGVKLERDGFSNTEALPDLRLTWTPGSDTMVWLAASRAIRSPTPFDVDVIEQVGDVVFLTGNPDFEPEEVTSYELGYRGQPTPGMTLSAAMFYDVFDDLRTIEPRSATEFLPLRWGNAMDGDGYGIEAWATFEALPWWRLSPAVRTMHKRLEFKPGASTLLGVGQAANDPDWQASLKSSMDLGCCVSLDAFLRYVDELPAPATPDYWELNARLAWQMLDSLEVSLSGLNLLRDSHREYADPAGKEIPRSVYAAARWSF